MIEETVWLWKMLFRSTAILSVHFQIERKVVWYHETSRIKKISIYQCFEYHCRRERLKISRLSHHFRSISIYKYLEIHIVPFHCQIQSPASHFVQHTKPKFIRRIAIWNWVSPVLVYRFIEAEQCSLPLRNPKMPSPSNFNQAAPSDVGPIPLDVAI